MTDPEIQEVCHFMVTQANRIMHHTQAQSNAEPSPPMEPIVRAAILASIVQGTADGKSNQDNFTDAYSIGMHFWRRQTMPDRADAQSDDRVFSDRFANSMHSWLRQVVAEVSDVS